MTEDNSNKPAISKPPNAFRAWVASQSKTRKWIFGVLLVYFFLLKGVPLIGRAIYNLSKDPAYPIIGMNYTNKGISQFWVNGMWASGLSQMEDNGFSGRGGTVCCIQLTGNEKEIEISWDLDRTEQQITENAKPIHFSKMVSIKNIPKDATKFIVYFYPHEHVEIEVQHGSPWEDKPRSPSQLN